MLIVIPCRTIFSRKDETVWEDSEDEDDDDEDDDEDDEDEMDIDEEEEEEEEKAVIDKDEIEARRKEKAKVSTHHQTFDPNLTVLCHSAKKKRAKRTSPKPSQNPSRPTQKKKKRMSRQWTNPTTQPLTHAPSKPSANFSRELQWLGRICLFYSIRRHLQGARRPRRSKSCAKPRSRSLRTNGGLVGRRLERWRMNKRRQGLEKWLIWGILQVGEVVRGVVEWGGDDDSLGGCRYAQWCWM